MNVIQRGKTRAYRTVDFDEAGNAVRLIEQRLLPHRFEVVSMRTHVETAAAIRDMVVRGREPSGRRRRSGWRRGRGNSRGAAWQPSRSMWGGCSND